MTLAELNFEPDYLEARGEHIVGGRFVEVGSDPIEPGLVRINHHGRPDDFTSPSGGYKGSGFGEDWGRPGIEGCLRRKTIRIAHG